MRGDSSEESWENLRKRKLSHSAKNVPNKEKEKVAVKEIPPKPAVLPKKEKTPETDEYTYETDDDEIPQNNTNNIPLNEEKHEEIDLSPFSQITPIHQTTPPNNNNHIIIPTKPTSNNNISNSNIQTNIHHFGVRNSEVSFREYQKFSDLRKKYKSKDFRGKLEYEDKIPHLLMKSAERFLEYLAGLEIEKKQHRSSSSGPYEYAGNIFRSAAGVAKKQNQAEKARFFYIAAGMCFMKSISGNREDVAVLDHVCEQYVEMQGKNDEKAKKMEGFTKDPMFEKCFPVMMRSALAAECFERAHRYEAIINSAKENPSSTTPTTTTTTTSSSSSSGEDNAFMSASSSSTLANISALPHIPLSALSLWGIFTASFRTENATNS